MNRWSLRTQLFALGLLAAVGPVFGLLLIVLQVEETESFGSGGAPQVDVVAETGVSPLIPAAAVALAAAAILLVWVLARSAIGPIERMTRLTDEVQAGSLDRRLGLDAAPVEIRELGESFDRMLDRLANASTLERRLIEDASHELRTPLAALSARLDVAVRRTETEEIVADLERCVDEVSRMQLTLDTLLASARSRQSELEQTDNDVVLIVQRVVEHRRIVSPDVELTWDSPKQARVGIDGPAVERAVANLVTNAVEHGGGAPVHVRVDDLGTAVEIGVTDLGPGIEPDQLRGIFERY